MNTNLTSDFSTVDKLIRTFPVIKREQKNFFEIAGFPRWENVMSNVLKFFLQKTGDHNLSDLVIKTLLQSCNLVRPGCINDLNLFETEFEVEREYQNIDVVIKATDESWAILIEHKMDHWLHNDLQSYLKSVEAKQKIMIVLSQNKVLIPPTIDGHLSINITHKVFISSLENLLPVYWRAASDKHLIFLKEFILNLHKKYNYMLVNSELEKAVINYQNNIEKIRELDELRNEVRIYAIERLHQAFNEIGFFSYYNSFKREWNHFLINKDFYKDQQDINSNSFRFFVGINEYADERILTCIFELCGPDTEFGGKIKQELKTSITSYPNLNIGNQYEFGNFFHLAVYKELKLNASNLHLQLQQLLYHVFLNDSKEGLFYKANNLLNQYKTSQK